MTAEAWPYLQPQPLALTLDHGWKLEFVNDNGDSNNSQWPMPNGQFDIDTPRSWTTLDFPGATTLMGTGRYSLTFDLPAMVADEWVLDLGDVRESARVRVNGCDAGTAWCVPFTLAVGEWLKPGSNTIEVEVTNLPANRIAELDRQQVSWRRFKEINVVDLNYKKTGYGHWEPMPSGLNGQVKLIPMLHKKL